MEQNRISITGNIAEIRHHNEENGYSVFEIMVETHGTLDFITVVGTVPSLVEGDYVTVKGKMVNHEKYGRQIKMESMFRSLPDTPEAIASYLASPAIAGIGPKIADSIVKEYGTDAFTILQNDPERAAREIKGLSKDKASKISEQLKEKASQREEDMYFTRFGISQNLATKIRKFYEKKGGFQDVLQNNPYQLIEDIDGIGFIKADEIAMKMGMRKESPNRLMAGIMYVLQSKSSEGHTFVYRSVCLKESEKVLGVSEYQISEASDLLNNQNKIVVLGNPEDNNQDKWFLTKMFRAETIVAEELFRRSFNGSKININHDQLLAMLKKAEKETEIELDPTQEDAVMMALEHDFCVITGGPGTGKTTTVNTIIKLLEKCRLSIKLAAPTGRAAKRMEEATGREAFTIHRLLPQFGSDSEGEKIDADVLIVDEASMIDIVLMKNLLDAMNPTTSLILVGDVDQLPSIGPGAVLRDIIFSETVPVAKLTHIHRQAAKSKIVVNATKINKSEIPDFKQTTDYFYWRSKDTKAVKEKLRYMVTDMLPRNFGVNLLDIQILCPMRTGELGVNVLNGFLQEILNPKDYKKSELVYKNITFREGDKVMNIKNNYKMTGERYTNGKKTGEIIGVFNGDIGTIHSIDVSKKEVCVMIDGCNLFKYTLDLMEQLCLAYATTVHKAQGSEYPIVLMPIPSGGPPMLLNKNLLYTAVTRAKKSFGFLGDGDTYIRMIKNTKAEKRNTTLCDILVSMKKAGKEGKTA